MTRGIRTLHRRNRHATLGFSLIEIMVVLVILLIGILAILRLFPGGFLTIQRTGELTNAEALVKQQLEAQKNLYSVPDAIIPVLPDLNGILVAQINVRPDDLTDFDVNNLPPGVPPGIDPWYLSNINRIRQVIGEAFRIPVPTPNVATGGFGATYMLQLSPVYNQFSQKNGAPVDSLQVYGMPLERSIQPSVPTMDKPDPTPLLRNDAQYAIDYERRRIAFTPRAVDPNRKFNFREFAFHYDYYVVVNGNVTVKSVLNGKITVPDAKPDTDGEVRPIWQPLFNDPNDNDPNSQYGATLPTDFDRTLGIKRDTEDISRAFRLVIDVPVVTSKAAPIWSDDPYEYAWYSEQEANNANVGVLLFNPRGHDETVQTNSGTQPFRARVDYATFDNHIIREDRSVPNGAPYDIKLSLPFILFNGDILDDQTTYNGMFRDKNNATPDLLIYNANTGEEVSQLAGAKATGIGFELNAKTGVIRLNPSDVESKGLRSATLRFFYRAQKDWGMQVQKAQSHYILAEQPSQINYRSYYIGNSVANVGLGRRIYFPISESGKTVILGEYFARDKNGNIQRFSNEAYLINDNSALYETLNSTTLTWIDLSEHHADAESNDWNFTAVPTGQAVSSIQGGSLKSRVIWRSSERWRKVDNDTFLTPTDIR